MASRSTPPRSPSSPAGKSDVVHEGDPLAPVVEGGQLADHRDDGVGMPEIVGRRRRQPLDLPDDVVAEIADQAAMKRGELIETRRAELVEERLQAGEDAFIARNRARKGARGHLDPACPSYQGRGRRASDEGKAAPALAVLDRLEQESGTVPDHGPESPDGRQAVGHELAPEEVRRNGPGPTRGRTRGRGIPSPWRRGRARLGPGATRYRSRAKVAEPAVETAPVPGVTRPAALLVDGDEHGVAVAVVRR